MSLPAVASAVTPVPSPPLLAIDPPAAASAEIVAVAPEAVAPPPRPPVESADSPVVPTLDLAVSVLPGIAVVAPVTLAPEPLAAGPRRGPTWMLVAVAVCGILTALNLLVAVTVVVLGLQVSATADAGDRGPIEPLPPEVQKIEPPVPKPTPVAFVPLPPEVEPRPQPRVEARKLGTLEKVHIQSLEFSPDGKQVMGVAGSFLRFFDVEKGTDLGKVSVGTLQALDAHYLPGTNQALVNARDGSIEVVDLKNGERLRRFDARTNKPNNLSLSADGQFAFSAGFPDQHVHVWDVNKGTRVMSQAFGTDAGYLSASGDGTRVLVHLGMRYAVLDRKGEIRMLSIPANGLPGGMALSRDGKRALVAKGHRVHYWDVDANKEIGFLEPRDKPACVAISPDGRRALVGGASTEVDGKLQKSFVWLYDLEKVRLVHEFEGQTGTVGRIAYSPSGTHGVWQSTDSTLHMWQLPSEAVSRPQPRVEARNLGVIGDVLVKGLEFSPDGKQVMGLQGGFIRFFDVEKGSDLGKVSVGTLQAHGDLFVLGSTRHALTSTLDGSIEVVNVDNGERLRRFEARTDKPSCMSLSGDGRRLFSGGHPDRHVHVWDVSKGTEMMRSRPLNIAAGHLSASADGTRVLIHLASRYAVWDTKADTYRGLSIPTQGTPGGMALAPDGKRALVAKGPRVYYWDVDADKEIGFFEPRDRPTCLALSPDGRRALVGGDSAQVDGKLMKSFVWLYDLEKIRLLHEFEGQTGKVSRIAYSPNGTHGVWKTIGSTLHIWQLPTEGTPQR